MRFIVEIRDYEPGDGEGELTSPILEGLILDGFDARGSDGVVIVTPYTEPTP